MCKKSILDGCLRIGIALFCVAFSAYGEDATEDVSLPPASFVSLTQTISTKTPKVAHGSVTELNEEKWYKIQLNKNQACTLWITNVVPSSGVSSLKVYSEDGDLDSAFVYSTDEDGTLRAILQAASWGSFAKASEVFYARVTGAGNATFDFCYQKAVVQGIQFGTRARPREMVFLPSIAPQTWYETLSYEILTNGYYYLKSDLFAGSNYYFGVSSSTPSNTLFSLQTLAGTQIDLTKLTGYPPWDSYQTNVYDVITYLTNREERVSVITKTMTISDADVSVTNMVTIVGVYTNYLDDATTWFSNMVVTVTNVDLSIEGEKKITEVTTNFESIVTSIQTNIVKCTNIVHVGMCRDAWMITSKQKTSYLFIFKGSGKFTVYNAVGPIVNEKKREAFVIRIL